MSDKSDGYLVSKETLRRYDEVTDRVLGNGGQAPNQINGLEKFLRKPKFVKTPSGGITTTDPTQPGSATCKVMEWNGDWSQLTENTDIEETVYSLVSIAGDTIVEVKPVAGRLFAVVPSEGISAAWANVSIDQPAQTGGQSTGEAVLSGSLTNDSSRFDSQSGINLKNAGYYHGVLSGELTYRVRADEITQEQIVYRTNPGQWLYQSGTIERRQATPPSGMQYVDGVVIDAWKSPILGGRVLPTVAVESFNDTQATLVASDNDANNPFTGVIDIAFALTWFGRAGTGWVLSASTELIDMKMKVGSGTVENLRTRLEDHSFTSRNNIQASDIVAPQGPVGVINPENTVLIKQPIAFHQDFFSPANQKFTYEMDLESLLTISSGGGTSGLFGNVTFSGHTSVFWLGTSAT